MTQEALKNYKAALDCCGLKGSSCENSVLSRIHMGLGDIYRVQGKFNDGVEMYRTALKYAADEESKKWLMLRIGQTYSGTRDFLLAEKSFSQIKEIPDGEFWPEVADFFISQNTPPTNGEKLNE
jgi:tetratricopeptide (TPR) repeat protein